MPAKMSVATIDKPEFINIKPYNPLISECEIKVFYLGENRNRSYITKEVATKMANSLPGNPIVGYFREDVGDFRDHGDMVTIDDQGVHFKCMTRPYGFVAPDAKVWFQKFEETDEFGNVEIREYLMTTGYLWTGQYPECEAASTDEGRPHSMELDEDTLQGNWARNNKTGMDFFIINDAIISKLCVLGKDVEPCFEGSTVTAPKLSASFTKEVNEDFTQTLYDMMQELKFALKGEQDMVGVIDNTQMETQSSFEKSDITETPAPEAEFANKEKDEEAKKAEEDKKEEEDKFAKKDEEEDKKEDSSEDKKEEDEDDEKKKFAKSDEEEKEKEDKAEKSSEEEKEEEEKDKKKFSALEEEYNTLKGNFTALEEQCKELLAFKNQIEDEKKTELINSFYMLSDEDKKEVIDNKAQYSLDEIEAKLSVICVRKKVNFELDSTETVEVESPVTTFNLETDATSTPAWVSAVKNMKNSRNI